MRYTFKKYKSIVLDVINILFITSNWPSQTICGESLNIAFELATEKKESWAPQNVSVFVDRLFKSYCF